MFNILGVLAVTSWGMDERRQCSITEVGGKWGVVVVYPTSLENSTRSPPKGGRHVSHALSTGCPPNVVLVDRLGATKPMNDRFLPRVKRALRAGCTQKAYKCTVYTKRGMHLLCVCAALRTVRQRTRGDQSMLAVLWATSGPAEHAMLGYTRGDGMPMAIRFWYNYFPGYQYTEKRNGSRWYEPC